MKLRNTILLAVIVAAVGCGDDKTPTGPGPIPIDPPPVVVNNTPPVIGKFTVQGIRPNEPPNFADAAEDVPVSVEVTDAESSVNDLKFNWTAPVGIFVGTGRAVTWKAPATVQAPTDLTINLEIVETYTSAGKTVENRVTGSTPVSLHDSVKEVGDMAHQFILDFSDSSIPASQVMRNFGTGLVQPDCYGAVEEHGQVEANRNIFLINPPSTVIPKSTTIGFGGTCPFRSKKGDACARVYAQWNSTFKVPIDGNKPGDKTVATGVDQIAAFYYRDQKRWKLCDSQFDPDSTSLRASQIRGLVP